MVTDRNKFKFVTINYCFIILATLLLAEAHSLAIQHNTSQDEVNGLTDAATVHTFSSPRLEYNNNEWRPVGRGDPLKNDPTYDYSPPALERVRYWAETDKDNNNQKDATNPKPSVKDNLIKKSNNSKNEILLLGVSNERIRGGYTQQPAAHVLKNNKGETPLLQPKYTSIRRSYYAHHQLPTHLMPPPMQTLSSSQQQQQQHTQMMKPAQGEYRHNMPNSNSFMTTGTMGMSSTHGHTTHYSTAATSPWMHTSSTYMSPTTMHYQQTRRLPLAHAPPPPPASSTFDTQQHQASANYFSYSRPVTNMEQHAHAHAPNAIHPYTTNAKQTPAPRKPWVHELLQKELIKSPKPTISSTKYLMGTTKPYFEPMPAAFGISTTYPPVAFISTPTTTTTQAPMRPMPMFTSSPVYITVPPPTTTTHAPPSTSPQPPPPMHVMTSSTTMMANIPLENRLVIPNTSNLPQRPTVAPMEMTTDSLFSHYKQPKKPLVGPMYLIIEGHSKVKTYGQNELDPHQPKIVPIIPNREPIVRRADPSIKRGTPETFQVKHLHSKPTLITTTPTTAASTTTTTTTAAPKLSTTRPKIETTKATPSKMKMPAKLPATKATTAKAKATPPATTTTPAAATTTTPATTTSQPSISPQNLQNEPAATGSMQGLFSFLDASLDSLFKEEPLKPEFHLQTTTTQPKIYVTTQRTILKAITTAKIPAAQPRIEARINSKNITSILSDDDETEDIERTTEDILRDTRQVFDYDQLPESRLKEMMEASFEEAADDDKQNEDDANVYDDNSEDQLFNNENDDYDEEPIEILKRIDKLVDDASNENEFEELVSAEDEILTDRIADNNDNDDDDDDDGDNDEDDEDEDNEDDDEFDARTRENRAAK